MRPIRTATLALGPCFVLLVVRPAPVRALATVNIGSAIPSDSDTNKRPLEFRYQFGAMTKRRRAGRMVACVTLRLAWEQRSVPHMNICIFLTLCYVRPEAGRTLRAPLIFSRANGWLACAADRALRCKSPYISGWRS